MDDTKATLQPLRIRRNPVAIGTGLVALDVVIPGSLEADPQLRAGGTCGNVLTALAYLGWHSYPIARLSEDGASKQVAADLRQWDVRLDFVTFSDDGSTPVLVQHIRNSSTGAPSHSFSRKCPCCGALLPWYKPLRAAEVTDLAPKLPKPQVFFFDRTSRGALRLARHAREKGALVFFEPSASSEPNHLEEALELAHIVKVSSDRIAGNVAVLSATQPTLVIETLGGAGLRFRHAESESKRRVLRWHQMEAIPTSIVRDTAGAGDWCSAGIIHMIGATGAKGIEALTLAEIRRAVSVGQAMSSWACGFDGPRGGMYCSERVVFQAQVLDLLNGRIDSTTESRSAKEAATRQRQAFACESCTRRRPGMVGNH